MGRVLFHISLYFSFFFLRSDSCLVSWNSLNSFITSMMNLNSSTMWSTPATSSKVSPEKLPSLSLSPTLPPIIFALLFPNSSIMSTLASFLGRSWPLNTFLSSHTSGPKGLKR